MSEQTPEGFGARLRRRREELGLSLDDVAASTRIRKTYLQALENENLQVLPGEAYVVGFLRIYARHLELPVEPLLTAQGVGVAAAGTAAAGVGRGVRRRQTVTRGRGHGRRLLLVAGVLVLLVAAGYLLVRLRAPVSGPTPPAAPGAAPAPAPVKPQAQVPLLPPAAGAVAGTPAAVKPMAPTTGGEPAAVAMVDLPVLPPGGAVVRLVPTAAGVAKVALDNQEVREYPLQPEEALRWKVTRSLVIELAAPGLARLWIDQQEVPVAEYAAFTLQPAPPPQTAAGSR